MLCEIQTTATFEGLSQLIKSENSDHTENENETSVQRTLLDFKIAVSPTSEIIIFAVEKWLIPFISKWDSSFGDGSKIKYVCSGINSVKCKQGEEITSVFCLPFMFQGQTVQSCADWTCIIVGFSSGWIRFYTEGMQEIASTIFHEEPVGEIKYHHPNQAQDTADIYVLYKTVICVVNGNSLSRTLRGKRSQASQKTYSTDNNSYVPIDFKKYTFEGQEEIVDACYLSQAPMSSCNTFDHLVTASLVGGFYSNYRASPPQSSLIVTSGRKPFVGFHYTFEGGGNPLLADVALTVANKIKSSVTATLPNWFGFGSKNSSQAVNLEIAQDFGERLNCRFGLCDLWRHGQSVVLSPDGAFSAVSDSLGRVMLIDNATGIAHRMWKGYRDAQCGFLQVQEDIRKSRHHRNAGPRPQPKQGLFIVIYTPKKGLVEIFTTQHGHRVTNFKVTKFGRLIYIPQGRMGSKISGAVKNSQGQVLLLSSKGISEFFVPFHCALAVDNSKMSRDLHVLKKIKLLLRMEGASANSKFVEDIEKCAKDLKLNEVRFQTIQLMVANKNTTVEAFKAVLAVFTNDLESKENEDPTVKKIIAFADALHRLLSFYEFLLTFNAAPPNYEAVVDVTSPTSLWEELRIPEKELNVIMKFIGQIREIEGAKKQTAKVAFDERKSTKLFSFLSSFDFELFLNGLEGSDKMERGKCHVNLKSNMKENYSYLGEIFFKGAFNSFGGLREWKGHLEKCGLDPNDLALCLLSYWCNKTSPDDLSPEMISLVEILKSVCLLVDPKDVSAEYNTESPWWYQIRTFIASNPFTIRGWLAALCCRSVTIFIEQEREIALKQSTEKKQTTESGGKTFLINEWETISKDTYQWDILITQLQDVALLNSILNLRFKDRQAGVFAEVPFDFESQCLASIQLSGTGRVAELVAKWMVQFGFEPEVLVNKNDLEFQSVQTPDEEEEEKSKNDLIMELDKAKEARGAGENSKIALDYLALLKSRFPYSLTTSSLLSNICWEYIAFWFQNISEINYLECAFRFLDVIPSNRIKYGISYLSWNTFLEEKFKNLAKMINRIGKVPRDKLCQQDIGLRHNQVSVFIKLIGDYLKIMLNEEADVRQDMGTNRETIWQNSSTENRSNLVSIAVTQPMVNTDVVLLQLQLSSSLFLMAGLNIKLPKVFSSLFDNLEGSSFTLTQKVQITSNIHNQKLKESRRVFLQKAITAAVQTIELVENIPPASTEDFPEAVPTTRYNVDEYKKWMKVCFDLAKEWAVSLDSLRRHQICELYSSGLDRLAEEIIPSVNENDVLASQLLVLAGKRLKGLNAESPNMQEKLHTLSLNLTAWLEGLELDSIRCQTGTLDDIEVIMRYTLKWLDESHSDHALALDLIESLSFLRTNT